MLGVPSTFHYGKLNESTSKKSLTEILLLRQRSMVDMYILQAVFHIQPPSVERFVTRKFRASARVSLFASIVLYGVDK